MRNYIELDIVVANTTFNSNYVAVGRTPEEAAHVLAQAVAGYGGSVISASPLKAYFELNKDNFYALMWFGASWLHFLTAGVPSQRIWNDGLSATGGFVVDGSDFIEFESPRKSERRKFKLVPIKK
jgi:hypothetical protein